MCSKFRLAGVLALPLLLGACGMPIGIQIASLFADSVSYLTTEKTLTDHGISAVADQDCALWRGLEGEDICRDPDARPADEGVQTALAEAAPPPVMDDAAPMPSGDADLPMALAQPTWDTPAPTESKTPETRIAVLGKEMRAGPGAAPEPNAPEELILGTAKPTPDTAVKRIAITEAAPRPEVETAMLPAPVSTPVPAPAVAVADDLPPAPLPVTATAAPVQPTPAVARPGASYVIIASYYRAEDATRFSKRSAKLNPQIIEGRAKGRQVFRVAVGPLERKSAGDQAKHLRKQGFKGAWRLTLAKPIVETEMAALR